MLGELLITAGVFVLLFLGWQLWLNDIIVGDQQEQAAQELVESWPRAEGGTAMPPAAQPSDQPPAVITAPDDGSAFATLIVPRLGADYMRPIAQGVGHNVLNSTRLGIGHYPSTQMPGEVGNFALASHRKAYGGGFENINSLHVGDHIYVATPEGWYEYTYRSSEYVRPTGVGVIAPVPQMPDAAPTDRIITLTTCNPLFSTAERIAAYGVFTGWYPAAGGPPAEIAALVNPGGA